MFSFSYANSNLLYQYSNQMSLNSEILRKIDPLRYFEQFLLEGVYPDGRDSKQFRPINIEIGVDGHSCSSSFVRQDGTNVLCTAELSIAPENSEPAVTFEIQALENVELLESSKIKESVNAATEMLGHMLENNLFFDADCLRVTASTTKSSLSSITYNLRWRIHMKITVLNSNGFIYGPILTAIQTCIANILLPDIEYDGEGALKHTELEDAQLHFKIDNLKIIEPTVKTYLKLKDVLVYVPIVLWATPWTILCDPTVELKRLLKDFVECVVGENKRFCVLNISCSTKGLKQELFNDVCTIAQKRHKTVANAIKKLCR